MRPLKSFLRPLLGLGITLALAVGCQSSSPTEPKSSGTPVTPKPPTPVTTYTISVTANPPALTAGGNSPSTVTIDVRRTDTGQAPPDLTAVTVSTSLGEFNSVGSGVTSTTVQLVGGRAQLALFPGASVGTATIRAALDTSAGAANVQIGQQATFFVSSIDPGVGNPQGGEDVTINGGGFDQPVRVTFNGATAQVLSVSANKIRVRTPSATAAGVTVGVGEARPVTVAVSINVNEPGQLTDSLANGFTYALGNGGTEQPQVFSISPASGSNDGGTRVTIVGDGFAQPVQVFFGRGGSAANFNGVEATVESVTTNRIVAVTPAARGFGQNNVNQVVDILVKNLNTGFSTVAAGFYKYGSQVLITAMGPGSGPYTGGTRVTIFGQGFDEPVAVSLGGVGQQVLSVTGTEIVFLTTGVPLSTCPSSGVVSVSGVSVTNIDTGDSATANLGFNYIVPLPQIFGISPNSGGSGTTATITGQNFASHVQVLFGDPTSGSAATVTANNASSISIRVPNAPQGFTFSTEPCDGNGDGIAGGTRLIPTPISVTVRALDGTGCVATLSNAFTLTPPNTTCTGDTSTPPPTTPQCADGIDNDGDGKIDFGIGPTNDPGCTSATDNDESG